MKKPNFIVTRFCENAHLGILNSAFRKNVKPRTWAFSRLPEIYQEMNKLKQYVIPVIFPVLLILIWEIITQYNLVPESLSASPTSIFFRIVELISQKTFCFHIMYSMIRLILGVSLGVVFGIAIAFFLSHYRLAEMSIAPFLQFVAGVPVVLWMPFCAMIFGIGELFKISLIAVSSTIITYVLTRQALLMSERSYKELADIYEKTYIQRVIQVLLPATSPAIFSAMRTSFSLGWIVLFFVEYGTSKSGQEGLAWYVANARAVGRVEDEFAGLIILGVVAYIVDIIIEMIQVRVTSWHGNSRKGIRWRKILNYR